jgi:hypothetical protein
MPTNVYFSHGTRNEQYLVEDLIIESLKIYGNEFFYIPRTLVSKDDILGEDRLSRFTSSFPIEMYFENVDSLDGQGAFIQKFGLMMEQSATLVVARRRWDQLVGRYGQTIIPTRPCEGDLIYFPLTKGLFEIKFVKHQDPFYQLGKLYVYKLQIELFQYSSERIDTGIKEVDIFETIKTFSTNSTRNPTSRILRVELTNIGSGYTSPPTVSFVSSTGFGATATAELGTGILSDKVIAINVTDDGRNYQTAPTVNITGGGGSGASAISVLDIDIDKVESFGDNNAFKQEAATILFDESNPFGEISDLSNTSIIRSIGFESTTTTLDTDRITMDNWR